MNMLIRKLQGHHHHATVDKSMMMIRACVIFLTMVVTTAGTTTAASSSYGASTVTTTARTLQQDNNNESSNTTSEGFDDSTTTIQDISGNGFDITNSPTATCPSVCAAGPPHLHDTKSSSSKFQSVYTVGVLEFRGLGTSYAQHNATFADYLTATAGQRFNPPIRFQMQAVNFQTMFDDVAQRLVDFVYVSPSPFSCVEAEYGAQSLVSHISKRVVGDNTYTLPKFAGVICVRADNDDISTLFDIEGKVVASAAISSFGGGQMQFRELQNAGMSYINDPKQVVFTSNQGAIVNGVLDGTFDVGFVRTDQIQRTKDPTTGQLVNASLLKILHPQTDSNILPNGQAFPFEASTPLYPEWNLASLNHVPREVSAEVQAAMLALDDHARVGAALQECLLENDNANTSSSSCTVDNVVLESQENQNQINKRCDTTTEIATIAQSAMQRGGYAGFRTTLSYANVRAMLQDTNFMNTDVTTGVTRCVRPAELYDAIVCPPGHFKKSIDDVHHGCSHAGLTCPNENKYKCVCKPCVKAFDVEVFPKSSTSTPNADATSSTTIVSSSSSAFGRGCAKMALCGAMEQTKPLVFHVFDNRMRQSSLLNVTLREESYVQEVPVEVLPGLQDNTSKSNNSSAYQFTISALRVGIHILQVFLDGNEIPESPLQILVTQRNCDADYKNGRREADFNGNCVCKSNTVTMGERCVPYSILLPCVLIPAIIFIAMFVMWYIEKKRREADSVWAVKAEELIFDTPQPTVIGEGTFGLVLLAEYRGAQVAVKRLASCSQQTSSGGIKSLISGSNEGISTLIGGTPGIGALSNLFVNRSVDKGLSVMFGNDPDGCSVAKAGSQDRDVEASFQAHRSGKIPATATATDITKSRRGRRSRSRSGGIDPLSRARQKDEFIQEMRLLSKLRHPCITTVMGAVIPKTEEPMLVMEYMNHGSLYDVLHNETMILEGNLLLHILRDIASGVRFLHLATPQVIHGDLKAANVLLDSKFHAKVADFGLSLKKGDGATGTPFWMAPELLLEEESTNTAASDLYSIGIILYEVYSRKDPYDGEDPLEVLRLVCDPAVQKRPPVPESCPPLVADLMKSMLARNPAERPTACDLDCRLKAVGAAQFNPGDMHLSHRLAKDKHASQMNELIYQVFPRHIADVLISGGKPDPETHEISTIFFSDVVAFTTISSTLSPIQVSNMLDRLYLAFDALADKHAVFKIDTIGDAYLVCANIATDQKDDHVKRICEFAMDAVQKTSEILIDEDDPSKGTIEIRVGFHSGAVVSSVVGSLNPKYSIFGDTVNVASRMESTSEKGRIQCSERSARLLRAQAPHIKIKKRRPQIQVKGKGAMTTYWIDDCEDKNQDDEAQPEAAASS